MSRSEHLMSKNIDSLKSALCTHEEFLWMNYKNKMVDCYCTQHATVHCLSVGCLHFRFSFSTLLFTLNKFTQNIHKKGELSNDLHSKRKEEQTKFTCDCIFWCVFCELLSRSKHHIGRTSFSFCHTHAKETAPFFFSFRFLFPFLIHLFNFHFLASVLKEACVKEKNGAHRKIHEKRTIWGENKRYDCRRWDNKQHSFVASKQLTVTQINE